MLPSYRKSILLVLSAFGWLVLSAPYMFAFDDQEPTPEQRASIERGKGQFKSSCGFCHGDDGTGNRAPDLIRSVILSHDEGGKLLRPVIRNGRVDKGMPAFGTLKDGDIADIVNFLHARADEAANSASVPGDYPIAKLLTGNAEAGKGYFNGAGGCTGCHSVTGDLAHVASKYSPVDLQQHMVYPGHAARRTATVTLQDGSIAEGDLRVADEFTIAIVDKNGWYHSWPRDAVKAAIHDPLEAHRSLTEKYSNADLHNLFAYLSTLK
jgi:cytochrome c oxidase cbb3-type subunit III